MNVRLQFTYHDNSKSSATYRKFDITNRTYLYVGNLKIFVLLKIRMTLSLTLKTDVCVRLPDFVLFCQKRAVKSAQYLPIVRTCTQQ